MLISISVAPCLTFGKYFKNYGTNVREVEHTSAELNVKSLSDDDREDEDKNISDNGYTECFLLIPSKIITKKFPLVAK